MRKPVLFIAFLLCLQMVRAQQKVVIDNLQMATAINYLGEEGLRKKFLGQLSSLLQKYCQRSLADTSQVIIRDSKETAKTQPAQQSADPLAAHLSLAVAEYYPRVFFAAAPGYIDSALRNDAQTIFRIVARLTDAKRKPLYEDKLDIVVKHTKGPGMGNEAYGIYILPQTFVELMRTSLNMLLDPSHQQTQIGVGVTPVYMMDNYLYPKLAGRARENVTNQKDFSVYYYDNNRQMIRFGEPAYEDILIKGKKAGKYSDSLTNAIKSTDNYDGSDYVFLQQESRDVMHDKNYLVKLATQVNPQHISSVQSPLTNFLGGNNHYLLADRDTVAAFSISRLVRTDKIIYPAAIFNGLDSNSVSRIGTVQIAQKLVYTYQLKGNMPGHRFDIRCSGRDSKLKEIWLDDKLAVIAQGKFNPEMFVVFDATLSPVLFNQLLIITFNRFLE